MALAHAVFVLLWLASSSWPAQVEDNRRVLLDRNADEGARLNAALDLYAQDVGFLAEQLERATDDPALRRVILAAVKVRAAGGSGGRELGPAVLSISAAGEPPDLAAAADQALSALLDGERRASNSTQGPVAGLLLSALLGEDTARAAAACRALGRAKALEFAGPLLERLEREDPASKLAPLLAEALRSITLVDLGVDPARWREHLSRIAGRRRDEVLEELLLKEREAARGERERLQAEIESLRQQLLQKDQLILSLKVAQDENDLSALLADLEFEVAGVRKFAADTLRRRAAEWDVAPAREVILSRLEEGGEPPDVAAAFLLLLHAIDAKTGQVGPEPRRDEIVVEALSQEDVQVLAAAALAASELDAPPVREAVRHALASLPPGEERARARIALLQAAGEMGIAEARDFAVRALRGDPSAEVRVAAANTLAALKLPDTRDDVVAALRNDADWRVRRRAAAALPQIAGAGAVPFLIEALSDPRPEVRVDVILALNGYPSAEVAGALIARLSVEREVLTEVVRALGTMAIPEALGPIASVAASADAGRNGDDEALWREARTAITAIAGDDPDRWREVARILAVRPERAAWAHGQRARVLEASKADPSAVADAVADQCESLVEAGRPADATAALDRLEIDSLPAPVRDRVRLVAAAAHARASRGEEGGEQALAALETTLSAASEAPVATRAWAALELAEGQLLLGRSADAAAILRGLELPDDEAFSRLRERRAALVARVRATGESGGDG